MAGPGRAQRSVPAVAGGRINCANLESLLTYRIALAGVCGRSLKSKGAVTRPAVNLLQSCPVLTARPDRCVPSSREGDRNLVVRRTSAATLPTLLP